MQARALQTPRAMAAPKRPSVLARTAQLDRPTSRSSNGSVAYHLSEGAKAAYQRDGFVHLSGVFSEDELSALEPAYSKFLDGGIPVPGKDLHDFRNSERTDPAHFSLLSVMLPRTYHPAWKGSLLERRSLSIATQLLDADVELDFDQILAKRPRSRDSGMPWHQDAAYWPEGLVSSSCDSGTANVWIAVSDVPVESGCLRYLPGSHTEAELRPHLPAEDASCALRAPVGGERAVLVPVKRGDVVVHHERVMHSSGPNLSDHWRCAYILNFKRSQCVMDERAMGVTHSLNDVVPWSRAGTSGHTTAGKP